jgi:predicted  nucleic acid-binding Zn-ribbon protein
MKTKCIVCGKMFEDSYNLVNDINVRIYCNECVNKMWRKNEKKR